MGKWMTEPDYRNRNGQAVNRAIHLPGTDHNQYVYILRCGICGHAYGANGSTSSNVSVPPARAVFRDSRPEAVESEGGEEHVRRTVGGGGTT